MTSDPTRAPETGPERTPAEEAGCSEFEATLSLMDGLLEGPAEAAARAHADACALCGPMLKSWPSTANAVFSVFEDAAERAKPQLASVADRVLAQIPGKAPAAAPGLFARIFEALRQMQAPVTLMAAVAAIAIVLLPILKSGDGVTGGQPTGKAPVTAAVEMSEVEFEHADGMVYRTRKGGMTIIWVSEHDGV